MTPYYEDDFATIYHGDCRDVLPCLSADVVLTDPPYGVELDYEGYDDSAENLAALIDEAVPLMLSAAPVVALTPGIANVWRYPQPSWILCLHTPGATTTGKWGFNEWQPLLVYGADPYLAASMGRRPDVVKGQSERPVPGHPCPKPLGTWSRVLRRLSVSDRDVVLDPFMGSGSTLAAAKYGGKRAIGIEQSEAYCEIAARRLTQEVLDLGA